MEKNVTGKREGTEHYRQKGNKEYKTKYFYICQYLNTVGNLENDSQVLLCTLPLNAVVFEIEIFRQITKPHKA